MCFKCFNRLDRVKLYGIEYFNWYEDTTCLIGFAITKDFSKNKKSETQEYLLTTKYLFFKIINPFINEKLVMIFLICQPMQRVMELIKKLIL